MTMKPTTIPSLLLFTRVVLAALVLGAAPAFAQFTVLDNGEVNVTTDTFPLRLDVEDSSGGDPTTLIVNAGATFNGDFEDASLLGFDNSVFQINGGTFAQDIGLLNNTFATFNGGTIGDDLVALDESTVIFNGGTVTEDVEARGDSYIEINGGSFGEDVEAFDDSNIEINGGTITSFVVALQGSQMVINDGIFNDNVAALQGSQMVINGGTMAGDVESFLFASIEINGGTFGEDIEAFEGSTILITGGTLGDRVRTFDDGEITILGTDFTLDGTPIVVTEGIEFTGVGTLAGILSDGTPFSTLIETNGGGDFINIVPEPSTGLLLLLGGATLAFRRRKR